MEDHNCNARNHLPEIIDNVTDKMLEYLGNIQIVEKEGNDKICGMCFEVVLISALTDILARVVASASARDLRALNDLSAQTFKAFAEYISEYARQDAERRRAH